MTDNQKQCVQVMRHQGATPTAIAEALGMSVNTVKSYLRRCSLSATSKDTGNEEYKEHCLHCGTKLENRDKTKPRKFCSAQCCDRWWNAHRSLGRRKSMVEKPCACCGTVFKSYPRDVRKYCSHRCYINARFHREVAL